MFYAILLAITLAVYANSLGLGIARDGHSMVEQDLRIREARIANVNQILRTHYWWPMPIDRLYRPITTLSFLFNYAVLDDAARPAGYHLLNVLLHALNVILVFELAGLVFRALLPALMAASIWAVHPLHTEVVANVAGRADLLAGIGVLGGMVLYARTTSTTGGRRVIAIAGLFVVSAFGVFAKENAAVLVGLMLLWDLSFGMKNRADLLRRAPFYAAAVLPLFLFLAARHPALSGLSSPIPPVLENPLIDAGFWQARLTALKVVAHYLWLLIFPISLSSDRSYNQIPVAADMLTLLAAALVIALCAAAIAMYRRDRTIFWCAGFFGIALLPTSNLIIRIGSIMAERFLYIPTVGFAVALAAFAFRFKPERSVVAILGLAVLLYSVRTYARNPAWNNDLALTASDVQAAPNSVRVRSLYSESLYIRDPRTHLDDAIREQEAAWNLMSPLPLSKILVVAPTQLGMYYGLKGDMAGGLSTPAGRSYYERALTILQKALEASELQQKLFDEAQGPHPDRPRYRIQYSPAYFYLGQAYLRLGRHEEGLAYYRQGIAREPENPAGYDTLIQALLERGDVDGAAIAVQEKALVLGLRPETLAALRNIYGKLPDGACAISRTGGIDMLDTNCSRVARDRCKALSDLGPIFEAARNPAKAAGWRKAFEQNGCRNP